MNCLRYSGFLLVGMLLTITGYHGLSQSPEAYAGKIVFSSRRDDRTSLYMINEDGTGETPVFASDEYQYAYPQWSPDGESLVYIRTNLKGDERVVEATHLTTQTSVVVPVSGFYPRFSYDGQSLVFAALDQDKRIDVFTYSLAEEQLSHLTPDGPGTSPSSSPDGKHIVFQSLDGDERDLFIMDSDGANMRPLLDFPAPVASPEWSPDGRYIAFLVDNPSPLERNLYVFDVETETMSQLSDHHVRFWYVWSPDASMLAYSADDDNDDKASQLHIINVETGAHRQLTAVPHTNNGFPSWSPDGTKIVFKSNRDGEDYDVYVIDLESGVTTQLTDNDVNEDFPVWSPIAP